MNGTTAQEKRMLLEAAPLPAPRRAARMLVFAVLGAGAVRLAAAGMRGDYLGFDESMFIILGRNLLSGRGYTLNGLPNATFPFGVPVLAGLADMLSGPRLAVSLPSVLLGALAVVPLYLLARRMASGRVAAAAAVLYAGFPALIFFSPFVSYGRRLYEGSEHIYLFCALWAAYFAYAAAAEGRLKDFILSGLFAGLAFEVRQEAALWTGLICLWLAAQAVILRRWKYLAGIAALAAVALAVAAPFLIHVRRVTGAWSAGTRLAGSVPVRDAFVPVIEKNDWRQALGLLFSLNAEGTELQTPYYGLSAWHRRALEVEQVGDAAGCLEGVRADYALAGLNLFVNRIVPNLLQIALLAGVVALCLSAGGWRNLTFIGIAFMPATLISAAIFPLARWWLYLAPFAVILIAWGVVFLCELAARLAPRLSRYAGAAGLAVIGALTLYGTYDSLRAQARYRADSSNYERVSERLSKKAAQWLFVNTPPSARVMASSPQPALLAGREWLALPIGEEGRVAAYARSKGADVLLQTVTEWPNRIRSLKSLAIFSQESREARVSLIVYDPSADAAALPRTVTKFLLVTVDTLRADHLGCYGYDLPTSPNIDRFAAEAVKFDRAFSPCSFTCPSITALMTSRPSGLTSSAFANGFPVPPAPEPTIAKAFDSAGYDTAAFVGNFVLGPGAGLAEDFDVYNAEFTSKEVNRNTPERQAEPLTDAALAWLEANRAKPFFVWIHYQDPHGPYTPPAPYDTLFIREGGPAKELPLLDNVLGSRGIPNYQALGERRDLGFYIAQYDGEISYMDAQFGRLIDRLREWGILEETVVVFTADHGEAFGENDFYCAHGHGLSPEQTRVPLLVRVPEQKASSCPAPVSLIDVAPTLLDLADISPPEPFRGINLFETLQGPPRSGPFFTETSYAIGVFGPRLFYSWGPMRAIPGSRENIKATTPELIDLENAPRALCDVLAEPLSSRPLEQADSAETGNSEKLCRNMLAEEALFYRDMKLPEPDERTKDTLRSLGYLNR